MKTKDEPASFDKKQVCVMVDNKTRRNYNWEGDKKNKSNALCNPVGNNKMGKTRPENLNLPVCMERQEKGKKNTIRAQNKGKKVDFCGTPDRMPEWKMHAMPPRKL